MSDERESKGLRATQLRKRKLNLKINKTNKNGIIIVHYI